MSIAPLAILLLVCLAPMVVCLYESLVSWDGLRPNGWGSLEGYKQILEPQRLRIIFELVMRAGIVATVDIFIAVPLADFILRRKSVMLQSVIFLALNIPFLISAVSRSFGWFYLLNQDGFLNRFLSFLFQHSHFHPITGLIFNRTSVIITLVATTIPFAVFPILQVLPNIRNSFWKASDDFGTSTLTRLIHLVMPIATPGILIGWFSVFWLAFGSSVEPSVVDGPVEISLGKMLSQLLSANDFSAVYALSSMIVITFILPGILVFSLLFLRRFVSLNLPPFPKLFYGKKKVVWSESLGTLWVALLLGVFFLAPVWSVLMLSLLQKTPVAGQNLGGFTLGWYAKAFISQPARMAWINSLSVALLVGTVATILAFLLGLTWWNRLWRGILISGLAVLALLPPDAQALGFLQLYKSLGFSNASLFLVAISHLAWALPFSTAIVFAVNGSIDPFLFNAGMEMKASRSYLIRKVLARMTWSGITSAFIVAMLMSLNDYTRASYLSGSNQMLSQYVYGQMKSGADPSVYAIGGINALAALVVFALILLVFRFVSRIRVDD